VLGPCTHHTIPLPAPAPELADARHVHHRYHVPVASPPDVPYLHAAVPVDGGDLTVGVWGAGGPLVVAAHGISATHQTWALVGPLLGRDHRFVAVDLRGRGGSRDLPPPYGMSAHAADLAAVIRTYGGPAILVGHSMGGFVVAQTVREFPDLIARVVLVDGGAPLPLPTATTDAAGTDDPGAVEKALKALIGPALGRLSMTFPSHQDYREFWQVHPAFSPWHPAMAAYADYDLIGEPPALRPSCRPEAALRDARDLYDRGPATTALERPAEFLRADRGALDQPDHPMYPAGWASRRLPGVVETTVAGTNHYTITLGEAGAAAVASAVRTPPSPDRSV
jgi:lipase